MIQPYVTQFQFFAILQNKDGVVVGISGVPIINLYGSKGNDATFIGSFPMINLSGSRYFYNMSLKNSKNFDTFTAKYETEYIDGRKTLDEESYIIPNEYQIQETMEYQKLWEEIKDIKLGISRLKIEEDRQRMATILSEVDDVRNSMEEFQNTLVKMFSSDMLKRGIR